MRFPKTLRRRAVTWATAGVAVTAVAGALSLTAASAAPVTSARHSGAFTFALVPSPGIKSCLPHAGGRVTIIPGSQNDTMDVSVFGMPKNAHFHLLVIHQPNKPFGVARCPARRGARAHVPHRPVHRGLRAHEAGYKPVGAAVQRRPERRHPGAQRR